MRLSLESAFMIITILVGLLIMAAVIKQNSKDETIAEEGARLDIQILEVQRMRAIRGIF
jgi:hypothetical protein